MIGPKFDAAMTKTAQEEPSRRDVAHKMSEGPGAHRLLNPADKIVIGYLVVIAVLIVLSSSRVVLWPLLLLTHAMAIVCVLLLAKLGQHEKAFPLHDRSEPSSNALSRDGLRLSSARLFDFIRSWYAVVLVPFTYKELEYLIPRIHPHDFDAELAAVDRAIFGVDPTVWLERLTWPLITEILQLAYITYYFIPLVLGIALWRAGRRREFEFVLFVVVLGFYLSYIGYISVPALGPRFLPVIQSAQTKPLSGVFSFDVIHRTLNRLEGVTRDCFPSGHTELTLLVLYFARQFEKRVFWWLLPVGTLLICSTVYLRYHYVIDIVAGAVLGALVIAVARPTYRLLGGEI